MYLKMNERNGDVVLCTISVEGTGNVSSEKVHGNTQTADYPRYIHTFFSALSVRIEVMAPKEAPVYVHSTTKQFIKGILSEMLDYSGVSSHAITSSINTLVGDIEKTRATYSSGKQTVLKRNSYLNY